MSILKVNNLCKKYSAFELKNVSFGLEEGKITGFIGRNGAGKSTTLKCLLNLVHKDSGEIAFFDKSFENNELDIKQDIAFVSGGFDFYNKVKIKKLTSVYRCFYDNWSEEKYQRYIKEFNLDQDKTPSQLSAGMRVKYALSLALSHNAKLVILDEPTSGIDPVSREELLDIFMSLVADEGVTIFFSTHITSDLEKCADNIIYIKNGEIKAEEELDSFVNSYNLVSYTDKVEGDIPVIGEKKAKKGYTAIAKSDAKLPSSYKVEPATVEDIMVHLEKEVG